MGLGACGTLAESDGGDSNLPWRGIVPFAVLTDDDEVRVPVLSDPERSVSDPGGFAGSDGVTLYVSLRGDESTVIGRAVAADGFMFGPVTEVMAPTQTWEGRSLGSPSVVVEDGTIHLYYLGGERGGAFGPVVGRARSTDGVAFEREPPALFPEPGERFSRPFVVRIGERWSLFVTVTPEETELDPPESRLVRYDSSDGSQFERVGTVLEPGEGCRDAEGREDRCWDGRYVGQAGVRVSRSPAGRQQIDLWYTGGLGRNSGIGFAGSYDGLAFSRYRLNPVLNEAGPEAGALVLDVPGGLNLYYTRELDGRSALFVAVQRR